jgi:hypothetical protein
MTPDADEDTPRTSDPAHELRIGTTHLLSDDQSRVNSYQPQVQRWLSAIVGIEHLSLLLGNGFTSAVAGIGGTTGAGMPLAAMPPDTDGRVQEHIRATAVSQGRSEANTEDQLRAILTLIEAFDITGNAECGKWAEVVDSAMAALIQGVLEAEHRILTSLKSGTKEGLQARSSLVRFFSAFARRPSSRDRLQIFTTNYDRLVELGCDLAGLRVIDRFVGSISPAFQPSRVDIDLHYSPPGVRGEPRYLDGVVRLTKVHGSLDWRYEDRQVRRYAIPFGASPDHPDLPSNRYEQLLIYPNPAKDVQTSEYPYADLFRDFANAICRPNSVVVTFGYGFGDDHIDRILRDMLQIGSTHLVVISRSRSDRIRAFDARVGRPGQVSLLLGPHFGDLSNLIELHLPRSLEMDEVVDVEDEGAPESDEDAS